MPKKRETLLGRIAVQAQMITMDQLDQALREQGRPGSTKPLGEILIELGFVTPDERERLVQLQKQVLERVRANRKAKATAKAPSSEEVPPEAAQPQARPTPRGAPPPRKAPEARSTREPATAPSPERAVAAQPGSAQAKAPQPKSHLAAREARVENLAAAPQPRTGTATTEHGDTPFTLIETPPSAAGGTLDLLLREAVERGASDVHIHAGAPVRLRIAGEFVDRDDQPLDRDEAKETLLSPLAEEERQALAARGEVDFAYVLPDIGRFRANVYKQLRGIDGVFRFLPARIPTLEELDLPSRLAKLTTFHQGIVLITGSASCGKSTTMAALVNLVNEDRSGHILTIEDPIEYEHPSKRCLVNQRHVHRHTQSFARALEASLREDPDVIVIGELRDPETIALALTAAETGHLVLATIHTDGAIGTVNRLVGAFPPDQHDQVRTMISESLRAVVSQRLVRRADGSGLVPAIEVLMVNKAVGKLIRDNKSYQIGSILQTGTGQGMCLLDTSLAELVRAGTITRDEALRHCEDPKRLEG
jgi:twitching motility protein PilT